MYFNKNRQWWLRRRRLMLYFYSFSGCAQWTRHFTWREA